MIHDCTHCGCHNPIFDLFTKKPVDEKDECGLSKKMLNLLRSECPEQNKLEKDYKIETRIYHGGNIRPMINGIEKVDAIGFASGKVIALGDFEYVKKKISKYLKKNRINKLTHKQVIKLKNNETLLPGLIEPHVHIVPTAMTMGKEWNGADGTKDVFSAFDGQRVRKDYSLEYLETVIKAKDNVLNDEDWLLGQGVDPALMPFKSENKLSSIDIEWLDCLNINRPILLFAASMHTIYLNTLALNVIVENMDFTDVQKDAFKEMINTQGALQELDQMYPAINAVPSIQKNKIVKSTFTNLKSIFDTANERGVTLMYDAGMKCSFISILEEFRLSYSHNVRIGYAQLCESEKDEINDYKNLESTDLNGLFQSAVKLVSDGSNQGLTGFQTKPYVCCSNKNCLPPEKVDGGYGIFNFINPPEKDVKNKDKSDYLKMAKMITKKGWPMLIHANGDKAIDLALNVLESVITPENTKRHRIEHCSLLNDNKMKRMEDLKISPSFLIGHVGYWGYAFKERIFKDKSMQLDLCNSMIKKYNSKITLHSDLSVSPLGPLRFMEQAVTRIMEYTNGEKFDKVIVLNEWEKISREDALTAITVNAAWQCNVDEFVGDLEEGKFADYIILKDDPLLVKTDTIRDIKVLETWVGGKNRYTAK